MGGPGSTRWSGHTRKRTVEETPCLKIRDLRAHIDYVNQTGEPVAGEMAFGDVQEEMHLEKQDRFLQLTIGERTITLEPVASNLVPGAIARWYAICPECGARVTALYRPTLADAFSCRKCHGLTYKSCQTSRSDARLYESLGEMMGLEADLVRDIAELMRRRG